MHPVRLSGFAPRLAVAAALSMAGMLLSAPGQAREGEAEFKAHCSDCHATREFAVWERQRPDAAERKAWMDKFLQRHFPPPAEERAAIIQYIEAELAK